MNAIPPIQQWRWLPLVAATAAGAVAGWLIGSAASWSAIGAVVGLAIAAMIVVLDVRPLVAAPVGIGAGIGAYAGATIVGVLCDPAGCPAFETTAAVTIGIGALVGVGLVVSLVARSFDEYRESQRRGAPPATSSCSVVERPLRDDQAVIVHYGLSDNAFGAPGEQDAFFALEDRLIGELEIAGVGGYDGNEFGAGEAVMYMYGPDADRLFDAVQTQLLELPLRPAYCILRYGSVDNSNVRTRRIDL